MRLNVIRFSCVGLCGTICGTRVTGPYPLKNAVHAQPSVLNFKLNTSGTPRVVRIWCQMLCDYKK